MVLQTVLNRLPTSKEFQAVQNIHNRSEDKKVTKVSLRESPEIDALADSNNIIIPCCCEYKYDSFQCLAAKN